MNIADYIFTKKQLEFLILNSDKYLAHISADNIENEKLIDHLLLVQEYFMKFIKIHNLEKVIFSLIQDLTDNKIIQKFVFEIFIKSIVIHDFGKVNPNFQKIKMNNSTDSFKHGLSSGHSLISGYIFSLYSEIIASKIEINPEDEPFIDYLILAFSYPILKHHSPTLNSFSNDLKYDDNIFDLTKFISKFNFSDNKELIEEINKCVFQNIDGVFSECRNIIKDNFPLFALLKLNFSLLTAADYYATTHFMNSWKETETDLGVFNNELKKKIINNIETTTSYNKKTYRELYNYKLEFPTEKSGDKLNKLRQNLSVEIINGIRNNADKNLFYIEAPTGGGKTNLSMLALAELLRNDLDNNKNNISKVFYVFPFTTLITQTFKSLNETLGEKDIKNHIVQIHSKAGFSEKHRDDEYGENKNNIIDYQFVNYPIALLSHIKFFDILKSNKKSTNYLVHRLANSVVIIDELQTYSPKEWDKVIYFINKYAKYFNVKFILMSATLPKIDKLLSAEGKDEEFEREEFVILNQHKKDYFQNPNFKNRVKFDFSMLNSSDFNKENKKEFLRNLWNKLETESKKYKSQSKDKRVHTIIEFIFKKTASEFVELVNNEQGFFDEVFILSGTILEPRRREIISKLKSEEYKQKDILLITTQVVEAGVDIDMDLGFKDSSLIDSDEQLAGRINRNVNKPQCKLFLFDYDDAKVIYGNDYRFQKMQNELKEQYSNILETKNFDIVYKSVMDYKNNHNEQKLYDDNLPAYLKLLKDLDFENAHKKFKLIDNLIQTETLFIPLEIPIDIPNSEEKNFTEEELSFLKERGKYCNEDNISGEKVWELYCDIIENKDDDFTRQKINKIIMQGLMSKFSISVGTFSTAFK
ncbi:MAG: CRISPR-associated helicase Cas3', partial [Bacteroidales bacterium]|nr:CRISPR-associated helicase Cas3' [Bacteroidales bacterium]